MEAPYARDVGCRARGEPVGRPPKAIRPSGVEGASSDRAPRRLPPAADAERVLFMSWRGWSTHLAIETVLAHAVLRRGGAPIFAYCGGRLPICDVMPVNAAPPMPCHSCREYASGCDPRGGVRQPRAPRCPRCRLQRADRAQAGRRLDVGRECEAYVDQGLPLGRAGARLGRVVPLAGHAVRHTRRRSTRIAPSWSAASWSHAGCARSSTGPARNASSC